MIGEIFRWTAWRNNDMFLQYYAMWLIILCYILFYFFHDSEKVYDCLNGFSISHAKVMNNYVHVYSFGPRSLYVYKNCI